MSSSTSLDVNGNLRVGAPIPRAGAIVAVLQTVITMAILIMCLTRRVQHIYCWKLLPYTQWLILAIYIDSIFFVIIAAVLSQGFGPSTSADICANTILLCLIFYMSTKLIVMFLMERAYVIRRISKPRMKDRLYLFNFFAIFVPYLVIVILMIVYRISIMSPDGVCMCIVRKDIIVPLIAVDGFVNVYMTALFVTPLRKLYSYQNNHKSLARNVALRTVIGSIFTLVSTIVNLSIIVALKGEAGWICLIACNADILFSVVVIHWMTTKDSASADSINANSMVPRHPAPNELHKLPESDNHSKDQVVDSDRSGELPRVTATIRSSDI
ncbi:hypothetical protein B0O99DRAFT_749119 [Bisporella sp. PMI_857]|nr:hypothetical protein B0O99DRAFT_749119 [Bisporella sp. PMI_857]